jgi:uncharacterized protein (DUF885 family)
MDRRDFLRAACAAALATSAMPAALAAHGRADPYARLLDAALARSPENATSLGLDGGARAALKHRLDDRSPANKFSFYQALIDAAPDLRAAAASGPRDAIFRASMLWFADSIGQFRAFPYGSIDGYAYPCPYPVSQLTGAYHSVPDFLDTQHTVATRADAEAYLDRLAAFPGAIDQDTANVRADAARGATPPAVILDRAIAQLDAFRDSQRGADAGLVTSLVRRTAAKHLAGPWQTRAQALVDGPVARAVERQRSLLEELRRTARDPVGVDRLPHGDEFYAACLRHHTSTSLTPDAAHALGLEQVAALQSQARAVLDAADVRQGSVAEGIRQLWSDPKYLFPNDDAGRAALLAFISERVRDMTGRLPQAFSHLPRTPLEVRRVPPAIELGSPGAYAQSGSLDGSRPGGIYFNLRDTANWARWAIPTTAYHEGVPGHHLQGSIANEATDIPTLCKLLSANAYQEGWALYAEQLADELGAYASEPLGRLGMLQGSLFRACRIVVDTGMHARGWSREQAIRYLVENAGSTPDDARREIERYVSWPGQACGYKIGHLEIVRLREHARGRLGARFDLKGFHDAVLSQGSLPLEVLGRAVDAWVATAAT